MNFTDSTYRKHNMTNVRWIRFVLLFVAALGIALAGTPAQAQTAATEIEPNTTCLSAQNVSATALPITINGSLDTPPGTPDVDYYRITGTPGERVLIDHMGSASGAGTLEDPYLGVFNSACGLVWYADDEPTVGNRLDARIEFQVPL